MSHLLRTVRAEIETTLRELWSDDRGRILVVIGAGWALSIGLRFVYPALVPFLRTEFRIDLTTTGLLLTVLWGAYAIGHVPGGILGDRLGEGNVLVISTTISAGTILLVAASLDVWMLFAGTLVFGLATALYGPTRFTVFTDLYPNRAGSAIGLTMAAGSLGNATFPVVAAVIARHLTWRLGFGVFVPLFVGVAVALWFVVPGHTSGGSSAVDELSGRTIRRIVRGITRGSLPTVVSIQLCSSFMIQGFSSFYPAYLIESKGLSPGVAASLFGLFFATGAIVQPLSGSLMDRFGIRLTLIGSLGASAVALWLLPFFDGLVPLVVITALVSAWSGSGVVTQTFMADALPEDMQGTGLGTLKAGWMLLGATSPLLIGVLADYGYFDEAFLVLAAVATVGLGLSVSRL